MENWLERTELILGEDKINKLKNAHVLIVGLGGIGSFAGEFIARSGVGTMTIIDGDVFDITNKNRQLTALNSTIDRNKAVVLSERIKDIDPTIKINVIEEFVLPERVWEILEEFKPDYVMDCIDSVTPKIEWIKACLRLNIKIITHLGAGGKIDPSKVQVAKLENVNSCKLGRYIRKRLRREGINFKRVKAVFSSEIQDKDSLKMTNGLNFKRSFYGTVSYMPGLFGLHGAAEVIKHLSEKSKN